LQRFVGNLNCKDFARTTLFFSQPAATTETIAENRIFFSVVNIMTLLTTASPLKYHIRFMMLSALRLSEKR